MVCRYNDRNYGWVAEEMWTFEAGFNVTNDMLDKENIDLVLEGVDTIAEVFINDQSVAELNNAHR